MLIRTLVIALVTVSTPAFANDAQSPSDASAANEDNIMCTANFLPATCTINYGAVGYQASGSNSCVALSALVEQVRGAAQWFLDPANDVRAGAVCTPDGE